MCVLIMRCFNTWTSINFCILPSFFKKIFLQCIDIKPMDFFLLVEILFHWSHPWIIPRRNLLPFLSFLFLPSSFLSWLLLTFTLYQWFFNSLSMILSNLIRRWWCSFLNVSLGFIELFWICELTVFTRF